MANTTFSGPILAGTIKNTTGTTVGTDMKNTGQVMMSQTFSLDYTVENTATSTSVIIPANSQIIDVKLDVVAAADDTNAATVSVGTDANGTAYIASSNAKAVARTTPIAAAIPNLDDVGTSDSNVVAVFTATDGDGTTGEAIVTVQYVQNNNVT